VSDDKTVHVYPVDDVGQPDETDHRLDGFCWCQPSVEEVPPDGRIFIHRQTIDSPHREVVQ